MECGECGRVGNVGMWKLNLEMTIWEWLLHTYIST